jgi:hypothetical protein
MLDTQTTSAPATAIAPAPRRGTSAPNGTRARDVPCERRGGSESICTLPRPSTTSRIERGRGAEGSCAVTARRLARSMEISTAWAFMRLDGIGVGSDRAPRP